MRHRHLLRLRIRLTSLVHWRRQVLFWCGAVAVGAVVALFAMAGFAADAAFHRVYETSPWLAFVMTPLGLVTVVWLTRRFFQGTEGSGIPQAIAALHVQDDAVRARILSLKVAAGKILLTCCGLLSGASIGREGPSVHIGAAIMYSLRQFGPLSDPSTMRLLIVAGGAAGVAAAFNTPLAGILFAMEEMSRSFEEKSSGTLLLAVILSGVTALAILGQYTYFGSSPAQLTMADAWSAIGLCGVVGGALGGAFALLLIWTTRRIAPITKQFPLRTALCCGLALSMIAWLADGQTYGTGYDVAKHLVTAGEDAGMWYPVLKAAATLLSYLSGIPGGIFAPSLSVGAGLGADLAQWLPETPVTAMVLLGIVGYFTGVVQAPLTALVIVTEMTDNSSMMLPLMATALLAKAVSVLICPRPLYLAMAEAYMPDRRLTPRDENR